MSSKPAAKSKLEQPAPDPFYPTNSMPPPVPARDTTRDTTSPETPTAKTHRANEELLALCRMLYGKLASKPPEDEHVEVLLNSARDILAKFV